MILEEPEQEGVAIRFTEVRDGFVQHGAEAIPVRG
jgi:hypothetical protein